MKTEIMTARSGAERKEEVLDLPCVSKCLDSTKNPTATYFVEFCPEPRQYPVTRMTGT